MASNCSERGWPIDCNSSEEGQPIDQRVGPTPILRPSMTSPIPSYAYKLAQRPKTPESIQRQYSALPPSFATCSPFRRLSQPHRKGYYLLIHALGITHHSHLQQQVFGMLHQVSQSTEVPLGPPNDLPVDVFDSAQRRYSTKVMAFNP